MPSPFESQFAANLDSLYSEFGLAAIFYGQDTSSNECTVRIQRDEYIQVESNNVSANIQTGKIFLRQSESFKPSRDGRFVFESTEAWTIETVPTLKNGEYICACKRTGIDRLAARRASS